VDGLQKIGSKAEIQTDCQRRSKSRPAGPEQNQASLRLANMRRQKDFAGTESLDRCRVKVIGMTVRKLAGGDVVDLPLTQFELVLPTTKI
jgi:hypothetical protein